MADRSKRRRGQGEGSLYQRSSDGMWCAMIELPPGPDGNRRRKMIVRKAKGKAIEALREMQDDLAKRGDLVTYSGTLGEWLDYWLDNISARRNSPGTVVNQRGHIDNWIKPAIGRRPMSKLGPDHVREVHRAIEKGSDSTTLGWAVHTTLAKALKDAYREQRIRSNPCDVVDRPRVVTKTQKALTLEQAVRLLQILSERPDGALWATYLLTGARRGEILGLEAERIGSVLDISWQLQYVKDVTKARADYECRHVEGSLYLTRLKTKKPRVVPLVEPLRSILARHLNGRTEGLVFTGPDGGALGPDKVTARWKDLLAEASLPTDVVLHGTRHTTVDLLRAAKVPLEITQEIVGHSSRAMTEHYLSPGNLPILTEAMEKMSALISLPPNPQPEVES
jgi:integrase